MIPIYRPQINMRWSWQSAYWFACYAAWDTGKRYRVRRRGSYDWTWEEVGA